MKWITIKHGRANVSSDANANPFKVKAIATATELKCHFNEV